MSLISKQDKKITIICLAAAATTVIAGILHITMFPRSISHNQGEGILFLVGGILQVFWALPVIKGWGRAWQIIGIAGTAVFVLLWFGDRLHIIPDGAGNFGAIQEHVRPEGTRPPGGIPSGFNIGGTSLPIEACQIAFIGLYAALAKMLPKKETQSIRD